MLKVLCKQFALLLAALLVNGSLYAGDADMESISECHNAFLVSRTQQAVDISIQGQSIRVPSGVYVDINRRLMWLACPLGQTQTSETNCALTSADQLDWQQALQSSQLFNQNVVPIDNAGFVYQDWRVPNIKELMSLYRHPSCRVPKTDFYMFSFPAVEGAALPAWSSTPDIQNDSNSLMLDLDTGDIISADKTQPGRVWLVREFK